MNETLPPCPECSSDYTYEPGALLVGTKVRGLRLASGVGDHDIDCKVDGVGPMQLKSSVVKKI
ncbi:PhnA domain-containing protein [Pseudarthrobacter sp. O4]|uniref:PhnA domain-containing protein n=1 Tax=Pseudarthrobacter sp. O4 TaxID=3418417 RepID=UPI003CF4F5E0